MNLSHGRSGSQARWGASLLRVAPFLGIALLAGALPGCQDSVGPVEPVAGFLAAPHEVTPVLLVSRDDPRPWPMDPWTYESHAIEGDLLTLDIRYGGGCKEHRFALLIDPAFMESYPVQVFARLAHDADGDMCRALLYDSLHFDLGPLRRHYEASYGGGSGTVMIGLEGARVRYDF